MQKQQQVSIGVIIGGWNINRVACFFGAPFWICQNGQRWNSQLVVNCCFGARWFGIRIGYPQESQLLSFSGILSESKPPGPKPLAEIVTALKKKPMCAHGPCWKHPDVRWTRVMNNVHGLRYPFFSLPPFQPQELHLLEDSRYPCHSSTFGTSIQQGVVSDGVSRYTWATKKTLLLSNILDG